jgi:hypothetical protein
MTTPSARCLRSTRFLVLAALACGGGLAFAGCAVEPPDQDPNELTDDSEETSQMDGELTSSTTKGDWKKFPTGMECLPAVQSFYPAKFGASVPIAGPGDAGSCHAFGACKIWLVHRPDPDLWERIPNDGNHLPTTYDLIVYPPTSSNPYGHIASVDHVEGKTIYVMDDNYVAHHVKASHPHTVATTAYGWYHLKKLGSSPPPSGGGGGSCVVGGLYCGGDKVSGDSDNLYECTSGGKKLVRTCGHGCEVRSGKDDACGCTPDSFYCGGDVVDGGSSNLYRCGDDGVSPIYVKHCNNGCAVHSGDDDSCK